MRQRPRPRSRAEVVHAPGDPDTVRAMADPKDPHGAPIDPARLPRPVVPGLAAEREATIAALQDAAAVSDDDAFDLDMLDERLELAMKARTIEELRVLTRDLPVVVTPRAATPAVPAVIEAPRASPIGLPSGAPQVSAIFSSVVRKGRRAQPRTMKVRAVFGSVVIDLREATFAPGVTTLHCRSVFGSIEVKVPPHVRVELGGGGVFGSFEEVGHNDLAAASPEAPVLHIIGKAVFASVEVICRPSKERRAALPRPQRS